jgi:two-component system, OmpR family, sensor kinase
VNLRLRLTLWYSVILTAIILVFGTAVYAMVGAVLTRQIDLSLQSSADEIIRTIRPTSFSGASRLVNTLPDLERFGTPSIYAQIWLPDGTLAIKSERLTYAKPLDPDALRDNTTALREVTIQGIHLRVYSRPVIGLNGAVEANVQTTAPLHSVDTTTSILLIVLISGGVVAVAAAAVIGWISAQRALAPLETITQTALQITRADDLSLRIPMPTTPQDEVGRLGMAFNESLERLERLFNTQRRFLADVSHELRTPLTTIRANVDLLRRMGGADPTSLDAIQSESERMSRLVGDVLVLAQVDAGTLPLAHDPVELDTLLLEVLRDTQVLAGNVKLGLGELDQAVVTGDRDRLKQILLNLVSNALKFTPEGGRVTMGLALVNDWVRVTITDTGLGIPPEDMPRIFDRFYRVDKARSRALGGAGLGLSIAQRMAQMHGGRIEAASDGQAGHGATFSLWLPLATPKGAGPALPA